MAISIDNQFLVDSIQNAMSIAGLNAEIATRQFSEKSLVARIRFDDMVTIGGEQFKPQLYLLNRNDGKTALRMQVGLFRLVCTNGLIMPAYDGSAHQLRIIHRECDTTRKQLEQLPGLLVAGMESINGMNDTVSEMQSIDVKSDEHAFAVIGNLNVSDSVKSGSMRQWIQRAKVRTDDSASNAWTLYNVVNEQIRYNHGFSLTAIKQDTNLFTDVQDLVLDVNQYGVAA